MNSAVYKKQSYQRNFTHTETILNVSCPHCFSNSYKKAGLNKQNKQQYKCKDCTKVFITDYERKILNYPEQCSFEDDIWTSEYLGLSILPYTKGSSSGAKCLNFSEIQYDWLKHYAKKYIKYVANTRTWGSLIDYLVNFRGFSNFLAEIRFSGEIEDINRELIIEYLNHLKKRKLSYTSFTHRLSILASLFELGTINNWFDVTSHLIRKEDYPKKSRSLPRYLPEDVIQQLNQHLDKVPEPIMRMVLVIQECGLRVGELCLLPLDCLKKDEKGRYRLQFIRWKMKQEDIIPISVELAEVIKEQQQYIKNYFGDKFSYLFCSRKRAKEFHPIPEVIASRAFINSLKKLAEECEIRDRSGKIWNFQSHQFRHTVGTRMINNGVPQHIIQRYLGHQTPDMTSVYAYIFDETLRKKIEKYHESTVVNFQGETVDLEETILSSNDDLEWFKKNVQARALEHGYCARPKLLGDCDISGFDGCYNCPHWRTNKSFLPILKNTLERTKNVLEKAQNCGWQLQVHKNTPIKENLEKVIKTLE
jgi:integrase